MRLFERPFDNGFARLIFVVGSALKYPQFWLVNKILSYIRETTAEREWRLHEGPCYERGCILMLSFVFGVIAAIAFLPFTIAGYFLWLIGLRYRNPFLYTTNCARLKNGEYGSQLLLAGRQISILSLNTKLLPESRSRTFNLGHVCRRARQISSVIVHASNGGKNDNSGTKAFVGGPVAIHGDSISQVSYGYLEKSVAYGDNLSDNRSFVSGNALDNQPPNGSTAVHHADSFSVGAVTGNSVGVHLAPDQITVTSLKSVEGMWQRRANAHEKTESTMTLRSEAPLKQLTVEGRPGSTHTLESFNSESRSRFSEAQISEANPSTMSLSSRMHAIPAVANIQNGSAVQSIGSGSVADQPQNKVNRSSQSASYNVETQSQAQSLLNEVQRQQSTTSQAGSALVAIQSSNVAAMDPNQVEPVNYGAGFSSVITIPSECPSCEIICLQEVSDSRADEIVKERLLTAYPHILHSAKRYHGFKSCPVTIGNLVIASKFPILCARYHEELTAFGKRSLLVAKLLLQHVGDQRLVAVVGNVSMKRNSLMTLLEPSDFDPIVTWIRSFRNDSINSDVNDVLSLDVCCGYIDMPDDGALVQEIRQHEFFLSYISPSLNKSADIFGAELEPSVVHDSEVNQPESLHHTIFKYQPGGPKLSQLFRRVSDVAGETSPFALLQTSFLRYCRDTPENAPDQEGDQHKAVQSQASNSAVYNSRGGITTAFAGLTTHLGLNVSFQN